MKRFDHNFTSVEHTDKIVGKLSLYEQAGYELINVIVMNDRFYMFFKRPVKINYKCKRFYYDSLEINIPYDEYVENIINDGWEIINIETTSGTTRNILCRKPKT